MLLIRKTYCVCLEYEGEYKEITERNSYFILEIQESEVKKFIVSVQINSFWRKQKELIVKTAHDRDKNNHLCQFAFMYNFIHWTVHHRYMTI